MSAATALALVRPSKRLFQRHPITTPIDLIALRSGVPETLPGRCTDICEAGVGATVAGELSVGQHVAIELRLPNVGLPVRVRAIVSYQSRLHCGFEFVNLSPQQREMIRYWIYRASQNDDGRSFEHKTESLGLVHAKTSLAIPVASGPKKKIRMVRKTLYVLAACILILVGLGWWKWQKSWNELEPQSSFGESQVRVSADMMAGRLVTKVQPQYPEAARNAGAQGLVVLDAIIGPDGDVKRLRPLSGSNLLVRAATDAVQLWKFQPYFFSGRPVSVETTLAVEFRLN